jgi:hypothetical protein
MLLQGTLIGAGLIAIVFSGAALIATIVLAKYLFSRQGRKRKG